MPDFRRSGEMRTFTAQYPGWCALCDYAIEPGDQLLYEADEAVHVDCARYAARPPRVCTECHLAPCQCGVSEFGYHPDYY